MTAPARKPAEPLEECLLESEVAEKLRVSRSTLQVWRRKGLLIGFRAGGRRLYTPSEVRAFIKRREQAEPFDPARAEE